ncbi:MAG TPA: hypothetical protein VN414_12815 [Methanosarcina sp.]|nr:hypothetical protein [Methanosarcina sp.]
MKKLVVKQFLKKLSGILDALAAAVTTNRVKVRISVYARQVLERL